MKFHLNWTNYIGLSIISFALIYVKGHSVLGSIIMAPIFAIMLYYFWYILYLIGIVVCAWVCQVFNI